MAALIIGVIVAGLGIGALVSAFQSRGTLPELASSLPAVTPVPQPSVQPVIRRSPTPTPKPTPSPTASASPSPSPAPTPSAKPSPTPAATVTPTAAPTASPVPTIAPSAPPRPTPTAAKAAVAALAAVPSPVASVRPSATAVPAPVAPAAVRPPPSPAEAAVSVVRRYIDALIAGNESSAYAALGGTSSDRGLDLKEEAFLDKDARITSMRASRSDGSGTTVDAEIVSNRGSYVATFHVTNGNIINQHDYIKI